MSYWVHPISWGYLVMVVMVVMVVILIILIFKKKLYMRGMVIRVSGHAQPSEAPWLWWLSWLSRKIILAELGHLSYLVHPTSWGYLVMVVMVVILILKKKL